MRHYEDVVESGQLVIAPKNFPGRFNVSARSDLAKRVITFGDFEPELTSLLEHFSDMHGYVVNIGANVGFYTVYFAKEYPNVHTVIAIEPNPEAFEMLGANVLLNEVGSKVELLQVCVGATVGQMEFAYIPGKSEYSSMGKITHHAVQGAKQLSMTVDVLPLGEAIAGISSAPKLIFIDTEGAELLVLMGAEEILMNASPVLIFECEDALLAEFGHSSEQLESYLTNMGYEVRNAADVTLGLTHPFAGVAIALQADKNEYSNIFEAGRH